jgi:hypothetical protein
MDYRSPNSGNRSEITETVSIRMKEETNAISGILVSLSLRTGLLRRLIADSLHTLFCSQPNISWL